MKISLKRIIKILLSFFFGLILLVGILFLFVWGGVFGRLPGTKELAAIRNEQASLVYSADGAIIGRLFVQNRTNVGQEDIPPQLINALVSTEDKRFFEHEGIDSKSYLRVLFRTILMGNKGSGGGSTISQQLIKNLYGRKNYGPLSIPVNKIKEAIVAQRLEKVYDKDEILLLYLNSVPFGENLYGVEAASHRFFNKSTRNLNTQEAALLIGMLKGNTYYNPRLHPERAMERRNQVLDLMQQQGHLSSAETRKLKEKPLGLHYSNLEQDAPAGYFVYQVSKEADSILQAAGKENGKQYDLRRDGLKIYTSLDSRLQKLALKAIRSHIPGMQKLLDRELAQHRSRQAWTRKMAASEYPEMNDKDLERRDIFTWESGSSDSITVADSLWHYYSMLNASVFAMDPVDGKVLVWVGGNNFHYLPYDLVLAKRQIASAFKPILYATALSQGFTPCTYLDNEEKDNPQYDGWHPRNFDNNQGGEVAMWYALAHSMNLPTLDLYFRTGYQALDRTCNKLGLEVIPGDIPSVAIGSADISLQQIVRAYCAFASGGNLPQPFMIEMIKDDEGNILYKREKVRSENVFDKNITDQLTAMLEKVVQEGTAAGMRKVYGIKDDIAGKTGTSQDYTDAWFIGFTPGIVCGAWVGAMDPEVHFHSAMGTGSSLALPLVGMTIAAVERDPKLEKEYMIPFNLPEYIYSEMECDPMRDKKAVRDLFENIFRKNHPERQHKEHKSQPEKHRKEKTKVRKFFDRLFKKK